MSKPLDFRTAFVITLAREIQEAGDGWMPDYNDLEARTGYRRSWCEKVVSEARRLAEQNSDLLLSRFDRARKILAGRPDTTGAELGRILGITGRRGAQLRRRVLQLTHAADSSRSFPNRYDAVAPATSHRAGTDLLSAAQSAALNGDTARAAQLSTVVIAQALLRIADALEADGPLAE